MVPSFDTHSTSGWWSSLYDGLVSSPPVTLCGVMYFTSSKRLVYRVGWSRVTKRATSGSFWILAVI